MSRDMQVMKQAGFQAGQPPEAGLFQKRGLYEVVHEAGKDMQ